MKPIRLEMTAFGPYKGKAQPIDFSAFGSGVYIITGPTGAGKTTIFDGVMFALFEEVSAKPASTRDKNVESGSIRDKGMLHSDYAAKDVDTVVRLEFEEGGKRYVVRRTIHFPAKRGGGFGDAKFDAELTGENLAVSGSEKVTSAVRGILKMDAVQFRQIVMLAQGEFRAFMEARDDKRKDILGGLFDSTPYRLFQERLDKAARRLEAMQRESREQVVRALDAATFYLPPETTEEERAGYAPDHPLLVEHLRALLAQDDDQAAQLQTTLDQLTKERSALDKQYGKAEGDNRLLRELEEKRAHLAALEAGRPQQDALRAARDETARALHGVKPYADAAMRASQRVAAAKGDVQRSEEALRKAADLLALAQQEAEKNPQRKQRMEELQTEIRKLTDHLDDMDSLKKAEAGAEAAEKARQAAELAAGRAVQAQTQAAERIAAIDEALLQLSDAESNALRAEQAREKTAQILRDLTAGDRSLQAQTNRLLNEEQQLVSLTAAAVQLAQDHADAAAHYADVYRRYMAGYAGKLAADLREKLALQDEAACPVCGSRLCAAQHPALAAMQPDTPDEQALEAAEKARNAANTAMNEAETARRTAQTRLEAGVSSAVDMADRLLPDGAPWRWEALRTALADAIKTIQATLDKQEAAARQAAEQLRQKGALTTERQQQEQARQDAVTTCNEQTLKQAAARGEQTRCAADAARLRAALKAAWLDQYASREEADAAIRQKAETVGKLQKDLDRIDEVLTKSRSDVDKQTGSLAMAKQAVADAQTAQAEAEATYQAALTEAGFEDTAAYTTALHRAGTDGEAWLKQQEQLLQAYANDCANTRARIDELVAMPLHYVELADLQALLDANDARQRACREAQSTLAVHRSGHQQALTTAERSQDERRRMTAASARMSRLAAVANGTTGEGGKRAFDGYVLGSTFEEVLAHASHYLAAMTGSKYELLHDTDAAGARKNAAADFRILVRDMLTGQCREVGSLSGGEGFQVSMALALGLSDTVQSHASTVKIDTMFIDEGFGSLDGDSLTGMMNVLSSLSGGQRQIGIISHMDALEGRTSKYIRVTGSRDREGSRLRQEY